MTETSVAQIEGLVPARPAFAPAPLKPVVAHAQLEQLDVRVG